MWTNCSMGDRVPVMSHQRWPSFPVWRCPCWRDLWRFPAYPPVFTGNFGHCDPEQKLDSMETDGRMNRTHFEPDTAQSSVETNVDLNRVCASNQKCKMFAIWNHFALWVFVCAINTSSPKISPSDFASLFSVSVFTFIYFPDVRLTIKSSFLSPCASYFRLQQNCLSKRTIQSSPAHCLQQTIKSWGSEYNILHRLIIKQRWITHSLQACETTSWVEGFSKTPHQR